MQHEEHFFWEVAAPLLDHEDITKSTMMGYPCLRKDGNFFASVNPTTGHLIVKLHADRVNALIDDGTGKAFTPNGRRFREWVLIEGRDETTWKTLMAEAMAFVGS